MVALMTFYGLLWAAGGNDMIAIKFDLSINQITYFMRVAVFVGPGHRVHHHPALVHLAAAQGREGLLHGYETGIIMRSPEAATPSGTCRSARPRVHPDRRDRDQVLTSPGRRRRERRRGRRHPARGIRGPPVDADVRRQRPEADRRGARGGGHHAEHEHELRGGLEHSADGHQFDGHTPVRRTRRSAASTEHRSDHPRGSNGRVDVISREPTRARRPEGRVDTSAT